LIVLLLVTLVVDVCLANKKPKVEELVELVLEGGEPEEVEPLPAIET